MGDPGDLYILSGTNWVRRGRPSIPGLAGRDTLVTGTYQPGPSTTGVIPGIPRTDFNTGSAQLIVTEDGRVFENMNIWGDIKIRAKNVRFKNCWLWGGIGHPSGNTGIIDANYLTQEGLQVTDCTITAQSPSYYRDGIVGHDYLALRNHIYNVNDGMGAFSQPGGAGNCNAFIYGNYVHDLVFWKNDPAHTDGTHNDCCQIQGGDMIDIFGNYFIGSSVDAPGSGDPSNTALYPGNPRKTYLNGQCVIFNQNTHILSNAQVRKNWFAKGSVQLSLNKGTKFATMDVTTIDNHFYRDIYEFFAANSDKRWIAQTNRTGQNITGLLTENRFVEDDTLLTVGRATGIRVISE